MAEQYVGKTAEFKDGDRRIIFAGDNEIGVFRHEGQFYAYSNFCLHPVSYTHLTLPTICSV